MRRLTTILLLFFAFFVVLLFIIPPDKRRLYPSFTSFQILDRNGRILREVLSRDYKTSVWVDLDKISAYMIKATILKEDKRFLIHAGIDPLALLRALYDNIRHRRIVSGGSTITMQVAKFALNLKKRNIFNKLLEILYSLKLELHLSKKEIIEIYLNRAPYGNQIYGVEAAANFYFRKPAEHLSAGESCILAVIPRSPVVLNPYINPSQVLVEKEILLKKLLQTGSIDTLTFYCANQEALNLVPKNINFYAPHFVDFLLPRIASQGYSKITSSIDLNLQENIEKMLFTSISALKKYRVTQGAVLVMETRTGEILSMVGSKDYFDPVEGQVNGCLSLRQPGSSIKPFLYALALSSGYPLSSILPDTLIEFSLPGGSWFAPRNFGNRYHGPTSARQSLASSFNIPSVWLLEKIGVERFYNLLKELSLGNLDKEPHFYGLSLGLGASEVRLIEMVNAYRAIALSGIWKEARPILKPVSAYLTREDKAKSEAQKRVFSKEVAYLITDVLSDNCSRIKAFGDDSPLNLPFSCAVKTGTTKDYRDNWCIGWTKDYVVGVWVGNFDGAPMAGVSGICGAAPLFRDIMMELHRNQYPKDFDKPASLIQRGICAKTAKLAGVDCLCIEEIFIPGSEPVDTCAYCSGESEVLSLPNIFNQREAIKNFYITNPKDGDIYKIDPQISYMNQAITFKVFADAEIEEVTFKLNNKILGRKKRPFEFIWKPKPGYHTLIVIARGQKSTKEEQVSFTVF